MLADFQEAHAAAGQSVGEKVLEPRDTVAGSRTEGEYVIYSRKI